MVDEPKTLYRVGEPSIGETYVNRWSYTRSSGALGTGVYAFVTRESAEANLNRLHSDGGRSLHVIKNALRKPLVIDNFEGLVALNKFCRDADFASTMLLLGEFSSDELPTRRGVDGLMVDRLGGFGRQNSPSVGEGRGTDIVDRARDVQRAIPQLARVGTPERLATEFITRGRNLRERRKELPQDRKRAVNQPLNDIFYPQFDGIYPTPDSGGDNGTWGACIWKQRVEECVEKELSSFETVESSVLNVCFAEE